MPTPILAHGGEAALLVIAVLVAILLVEMAVAIVILALGDLLVGSLVLLTLKKKRHLFWMLPVLNFACWYVIGQFCLWLPQSSGSFQEFNVWAIGIADWLMHPLSFVSGLLMAGMLAPFQIATGKIAGHTEPDSSTQNETAETQLPTTGAVDTDNSRWIGSAAAEGRWPAFREGFLAPWDGLGFMCRHRNLWKYGIVPVILNVLITGAILIALIVAVGFGSNRLHPLFPAGWGWFALEIVCGIVLVLLALLGAFAAWLLLQGALCGYSYGKLAEQVELKLGMSSDEMRGVSLTAQTADAIRDISLLLGINIGLLVLHVVPVVGSIVAMCGSTYFNLMILGGDFVNFPLDLRGMRRAEKRAYTRRFRYHTLGLGAVVTLLLLVPVVGAVLLTTAVTGSVLLHRRQQLLGLD